DTQAGQCKAGQPVNCAHLDDACNLGVCSPADGQCAKAPKADGAACDDGNACTQVDTCQGGVCTGTAPVVCTPLSQCHEAGVCNPATGLCSEPLKANGSPCDDSDPCTLTDTCQAGSCFGSGAPDDASNDWAKRIHGTNGE